MARGTDWTDDLVRAIAREEITAHVAVAAQRALHAAPAKAEAGCSCGDPKYHKAYHEPLPSTDPADEALEAWTWKASSTSYERAAFVDGYLAALAAVKGEK